MESTTYLGLAGKAHHNPEITKRYNRMLKALGPDEMLIMWERWADDEDIESMLQHSNDILGLNNIKF